jgi:CheY-like chemotaxis protein/tetratricopeptide (TPR) repeat protein
MSKKLLIADDDSSIVSILTYAFGNKGYEIIAATSGEEARKLAYSEKPDAIILDALMPRVDGFTLLKEFRAAEDIKDTPIIMISGVYKTYDLIQNTIKKLGANDYFKKPFNLDALVKRVQTLCPTPQPKEKKAAKPKSISKYLFIEKIPDNGEFRLIPVFKVFATLFNQKKSGVLVLSDKSVEKKIMIKNGSPIEVSSNVAGEWLGRLLVREDAITSKQYSNTIELMGKVKKRHGEVLLEKELIDPPDLYKYLKMQLIEKIINTFNWTEGAYSFSADKKLERVSPKTVNVYRMIFDGISAKIDIDFIKSELSEISGNSVFVLKNKKEIYKSFDFTGDELKLLESFDGSKKLSSIQEEHSDVIDEFYILFYTLLVFNSVRLLGEVSGKYEKLIKASKYAPKSTEPLTKEEREVIKKISELYKNFSTLSYYELFDIPKDADSSGIKKAYFKLMEELHPDKLTAEKFGEVRGRADKVFFKIANAYQTLSDNELRRKYDQELEYGADEELKKTDDVLTAEMQFQKGISSLKSKGFEKAHEAFDWAIRLHPKEAEYHLYKAITIFKDPRKDRAAARLEAKRIMEDVISMNANLFEAHYYLGMIYKLEDNMKAAEKQFKIAAKLNPKHLETSQELRLMEMRKEKKKGFFKSLFK